MSPSKRYRLAAALLFFLPLGLLLIIRPFDQRLGLTGTYYSRVDWTGARFNHIDYQIATDALIPSFAYAGGRSFAVSWEGLVAIDRTGTYQFEIVSDDGSTVRVDDRWLINISGTHGPLAARGEIKLERGLHPIQIDFYQSGGDWKIDLFWAHDGGDFQRVPASALLHKPIGMTQYSALKMLSTFAPLVPVFWIGAALLLALSWVRPAPSIRSGAAELLWPPLLVVLLVSLALSTLGVWWGFPDGWAADEIGPRDVVSGLMQLFSAGWYSKYPLFHYLVLSVFSAPSLLADALRPSDPNAQGMFETLFILHRLVSVAMGAGTTVACYFCARALKGRVAGLLAAAIMASVLPFVYYAKVVNTDVPYLFWFAWSMFAYIHIIQGRQDGPAFAYRLFALTATLSICTKDQAYGFFFLPAVHIVWLRYRQLASASADPLKRLVTDRVLISSAAIAVATFVVFSNLLFNFGGFVEHVRLITGGASVGYQMVPGTLSGRAQLVVEIVRLVRWSFGWPLFVLAVTAVAATLVKRDHAAWLLLPGLSYYLFFLNVVLYAYDRFVLGLCVLMAIMMGCRLSEWIAQRGMRAIAVMVLLAAGFGRALVGAASLDAMMVWDSRYVTQQWARRNVPHDAAVVMIGRFEYLPVFSDFIVKYTAPEQVEDVPYYEYIVLNVKYMRRYGPGTPAAALYKRLSREEGYTCVFRLGPSLGWLPLARDPVFRSPREDPYSNLAKIDPEIEIYRKKRGS